MDLKHIISSFAKIIHNIQSDCNIPMVNVLYSQSVHNLNKPIDDYISNWELEESDIDINYISNNKYSKKISIVKPVKIVNLYQVKSDQSNQVLLRLRYYEEMYKFYNQYSKYECYGLNNISKYVNHLNQII